MRCVAFVLLLLLAAPADGAAQSGPQAALDRGDWVVARNLGRTGSDAASQTLAAEAVLSPLVLGLDREVRALRAGEDMRAPVGIALEATEREVRRDAARQAAGYARAAIDADPDYAPAHRALAAALGIEGRNTHPLRAALSRLPGRSREAIDRAIELDPVSPAGRALLGAWHLEIVRRAGEGTFGADLETGLEQFRAAAAAETGPPIPYQFALHLLALDPAVYGDEAEAMLGRAVEAETNGAFEAAIKAQAQTLFDLALTSRAAAAEEARDRLSR
ncbi:MAG: hypothetical protein ABL308_09000 [Oceanicaulis sp.]